MSERESAKLLDAWLPPADAGAPLGCVATTFSFDPGFVDEECLARFLELESALLSGASAEDSRVFLLEREERLTETRAAVLVDRGMAEPSPSFRWDVIPVSAGRGGVQHAKVTLLLWQQAMRLIVASANLTYSGYRSNVEVFTVFDDGDAGVPTEVFTEGVGFLNGLLRTRTRGDRTSDSPYGRATGTIALAQARARARSHRPRRGRPTVAFLHTLREGDLVRRAFETAWTSRSPARDCRIASPYFDDEPEAALAAVGERLARRGPVRVELAVVARQEGEGQVKVDAPPGVAAIRGRTAPVLRAWPTGPDDAERTLHAKCISYSNDELTMLMAGSANATGAGLGIGSIRNVEAVVVASAGLGSEAARSLAGLMPPTGPLPEGDLIFEGPAAEDREREAVLPVGFVEALYHPADEQITVRVEPGKLPEQWEIIGPCGRWFSSGGRIPKNGELVRKLNGTPAPHALQVSWFAAGSQDQLTATLVVGVIDPRALPEPPELASLSLEELLDLLAAGGRLHALLARLVRRRMGDLGEAPQAPELDPHKRVDTSGFILQRTRRAAYALEGLRRRLREPIASRDALDRRLRGRFGPMGLASASASEVKAGGMSDRERAYLLAEVALVVQRTDWNVIRGAVTKKACREAAGEVLTELRPRLTDDAALDAYVVAAFDGGLT